jgi:hypothetical protein
LPSLSSSFVVVVAVAVASLLSPSVVVSLPLLLSLRWSAVASFALPLWSSLRLLSLVVALLLSSWVVVGVVVVVLVCCSHAPFGVGGVGPHCFRRSGVFAGL